MDDDPASSCIAEQSIATISKVYTRLVFAGFYQCNNYKFFIQLQSGKIYIGNDNNNVQTLSYPDLEKEGIAVRFSAAVTALATQPSSNLIVAGSV